jgi:RHS repeat-associated protein
VQWTQSGVTYDTLYDASGEMMARFNEACNNWDTALFRLGHQVLGTYDFSSNVTHFLHANALDSGTVITDGTSSVVNEQLFYPWGTLWEDTSQSEFHFAAFDWGYATPGVLPTPNRMYSYGKGRWMTPDPAGLAAGDPSNPESLNRYAYVMNNPTTLTDPSGLISAVGCDPFTGIGCEGCDPWTGECPPPTGPFFPVGGGGGEGGGGGSGGGGGGVGGGAGGTGGPTTSGGHFPTSAGPMNGGFGPTWALNPWQIWGPFGSSLPCDFGPCVVIGNPFTGQVGVSVGWTFPWGVNVNFFAGFAVDLHGHFAFYHGRGVGAGLGARASGGVQVGYSNANTVCGLAGPFANASGTLGAEGAAGTVDVFQGSGNGPGGIVTGGGGYRGRRWWGLRLSWGHRHHGCPDWELLLSVDSRGSNEASREEGLENRRHRSGDRCGDRVPVVCLHLEHLL